jgi:hypothetical protein
LLPNEIDDVENIKSTKFYVGYKYKIHEYTKPQKLMPTKKITFTVSNITTANTQARLNIYNTMYRTTTN